MADARPSGRRKRDGVQSLKLPVHVRGLSSWTVLTTLSFCIVGLIAGGLLYYSYVQDRKVFLTKQHFRNLDTIGRNLSEATKAFEKVIESSGIPLQAKVGQPGDLPSLRDQRCFSEPFIRVTGIKEKAERKKFSDTLEKNKPFFTFLCASTKLSDVFLTLDLQRPIDMPLDLFTRQKNNEPLKLALDEGYEFKSLMGDRLALIPAPDNEDEHAQRYLVTPEINGRRGLRLEKGLSIEGSQKDTLTNCAGCKVTLHARFELQPLLDELVVPDTFADVLVADEKGNIIVHRPDKERSADTRLERLDRLLRQETEGRRNLTIQPDDSTRTVSLWEQLPLQRSVRLGESEYYLYAQAVPIDSWRHDESKNQGGAGRVKLIVVGLVPVTEVMWQALAIPHGVSLMLIFLSFALTFTLPLIKLATMGPRDRLGLPDALGCMLFSMMGAALLTFTIGAWGLHNNATSTADEKLPADNNLQSAASTIQTKFEAELRGLLWRLTELTKGDNVWNHSGKCVAIDIKTRKTRACFGVSFPWSTPPFVHTAIRVDPLGNILSLNTIRRTSILTRNVQGRHFVRAVWAGDLLHLKPKPGQSDISPVGFSIEPIYAWDDGEFGTMLAAWVEKSPNDALRAKESDGAVEEFRTRDVVAIRTRLISLVGTVVPIGYGYAVINDDGQVLYAADKNRNLRENLFSETDHDVQLKSLVGAKTNGTIRVNYRGRAHVMHVSRLLEPLPWTLIVYRDTRWLDWVTDQALFFGVALFTCYSFVILVGGLFVLIIFQSVRSGEGGWMWPAEGRVHTYYSLVVFNLVVMLIAVVITWSLGGNHPGWVPLATVGLSATAMGVTVWTLKQSKGTDARDKLGVVTLETKWAYSVLATTAILVMAAMPSGVFLTVGFERALSLYESYAADAFYKHVEKRKKENDEWYRHILPEGHLGAQQSLPTQYKEFFSETLDLESIPANLTTLPKLLNERMRDLLHLWMWEPGRQLGGWIAHPEKSPQTTSPSNLFASNEHTPWLVTIGLFTGIVSILWYMWLCEDPREKQRKVTVAVLVAIVGFVLLLYFIEDDNPASSTFSFAIYMGFGSMVVTAATYGSQRLVCHYLFLIDFAKPLTNSRIDDRLTCHVLIVVPPAKDPLTKLDREKWKVLPVPTLLADYQESDNPWPDYVTDESCPLVITGFDHRLSERHQAVRMLNLIERLALQPDRPILVVSHRHPFDSEIVSFESSNIPVQDRSTVFSRDRWAAAFKNFLVIPYSGFRESDDQMEMVDRITRDPTSLTHKLSQSLWMDWVENRTLQADEEADAETRYALGVLRCRYEYWWADCSPSEKIALWHVATDRFLHASNSKLYPLLWKGLLKLDPDIKLHSRSWQLFVKQAGDRDQLAFLRHDLKPSTWAKVSRPLLLGLLSSVAFLAVTQENVREVVIALVPVLPAFLIEIPRLLSGGLRSAISKET